MPISDALKQDAWQSESNLPLVLIEIDHDSIVDGTIRLVNNKVNIMSGGEEYIGFPFEIILPDSKADAPPTAKIRIDNVSREIGQAIRSISTPPLVTIKVVRQETPDVLEAELSGMYLTNVSYDAMSVEADLMFEDLTRETFPAYTFSPANYRGIL
jgi:hypothetical protein